MPNKPLSTAGTVYVEFVIAFIPVFLFFLGIVQMALISSARLVVQHAAVTGARSAIVVLEDNHVDYRHTPFGKINEYMVTRQPSVLQKNFQLLTSWFNVGKKKHNPKLDLYQRGGPRLRDIRSAVYLPLLAISPAPQQLSNWFNINPELLLGGHSQTSLIKAIGMQPHFRFIFGIFYNKAATAVTFPERPGSSSLKRDGFGPNDLVTIRVTHLFPCLVPLVSRVMCRSLADLWGFSAPVERIRSSFYSQTYSHPQKLQKAYRQFQSSLIGKDNRSNQLVHELSHVEAPFFLISLMMCSTRFVVLRSEASMLNQGAEYYRK